MGEHALEEVFARFSTSLLTTDAARRGLMERVIVRWMWDERLGRCVKWLRLPPGGLWSNVAEAIRTTEPAIFAELQAAASDECRITIHPSHRIPGGVVGMPAMLQRSKT